MEYYTLYSQTQITQKLYELIVFSHNTFSYLICKQKSKQTFLIIITFE